MSSWGIQMELIQIALRAPCHPREGSLHLAHGEEFYPAGIPPHPDISHPDVSREPTFHIWISHSRIGEEDVSTSLVRHIRILRQRLPGEFFSQYTVQQCSPEAS